MLTFPRRALKWRPIWLLIGLLAWKIIQTLLGNDQDIPITQVSELMRPYNGGVEW